MDIAGEVPGATPIDDVSGLRQAHLKTRPQLNAAEAENIRQATVRYLIRQPTRQSAPFNVAWFRKLHREMFGRVWKWAGTWRQNQTNVGVAPAWIEVEMLQLEADLLAWSNATAAMPLMEQAVRLHHRAVHVHPFTNGNGRWSRMLANIWLRRHGQPIIEWPDSVIGTASTIRDQYLHAVRKADGGDFEPLAELHRRYQGGSPASS